jgi:hypothetical protein
MRRSTEIKPRTKIGARIAQAARAERYPLAAPLLSFLEAGQEKNSVSGAELDAAARIANKSGLKKVDKRALWRAIKSAHAASGIIDKYRPAPRLNKCLADLQNLQKAARQLEALLCRDNDATDLITSTKNGAKLVYEFLNLKARIDSYCDFLKEEGRSRDRRIKRRVITRAEWLAGVALPCIYEEFSSRGLPEGYPPTSEIVAFVESAMKELGLRYGASSIGKAIRTLRTERRERSRALGKNVQ